MRKLGSDRPDLLIRLLDDEELRKSATHFFHQLGKSMDGGLTAAAVTPPGSAAQLIKKLVSKG